MKTTGTITHNPHLYDNTSVEVEVKAEKNTAFNRLKRKPRKHTTILDKYFISLKKEQEYCEMVAILTRNLKLNNYTLIWKFRKGLRKPSLDQLAIIAKTTGLNEMDLFNDYKNIKL